MHMIDASDLIGDTQAAVARPINERHVPTLSDRKLCLACARFGMPHEDIAKALDIGVDTLRARYGDILERGELRAIARVGEALYLKAVRGDVGAIALWTKAKGNKFHWLRQSPPVDQSGTTINLQFDAAQAISSMFASLKRGDEALPAPAKIVDQTD